MRPTRDVRRQVGDWLPAAVLVAVLLGLAAMHGLAPHGALGHDAGTAPAVHAAGALTESAPATHAAHAFVPVAMGYDTAADARLGRPFDGSTEESAPVDAGALQACVAVLLVVGAVLHVRGRRSTRPVLLVSRSPVRAVVASHRIRDPDPPSLAQLAVLRC